MHEILLLINIWCRPAAALVGGLLAPGARAVPPDCRLISLAPGWPSALHPGLPRRQWTRSASSPSWAYLPVFASACTSRCATCARGARVAHTGAAGPDWPIYHCARLLRRARWWGLGSGEASIVLGLAISIAAPISSSQLMDEGLLDSRHGAHCRRLAGARGPGQPSCSSLILPRGWPRAPTVVESPPRVHAPPGLGVRRPHAAAGRAGRALGSPEDRPHAIRASCSTVHSSGCLTLSSGGGIALTAGHPVRCDRSRSAPSCRGRGSRSRRLSPSGRPARPCCRSAEASPLFFVWGGDAPSDPRDLVAHAGHVALPHPLDRGGQGLGRP